MHVRCQAVLSKALFVLIISALTGERSGHVHHRGGVRVDKAKAGHWALASTRTEGGRPAVRRGPQPEQGAPPMTAAAPLALEAP